MISTIRQRLAIGLLFGLLLLCAACGPGGGESPPSAAGPPATPASGPRWFTDATEEFGLAFVHETGASGKFLMPEIMTAGVALFDCDGDGDLDAYFTNGTPETNRLFRLETDGKFVDATEESGLGDAGYGMGVAVGDIDNDGDADVYLTNDGPDRLYLNRGDGTFEEATERAGIVVDGWSSSATFLDYDRDGFLDLYVARYVRYDPNKHCTDSAGRTDYCSPGVFPPVFDVLLRNDGDGTFTDVSESAGILGAIGAGLGVAAIDFDDDGWTDIFVANDGDANVLWLNQGNGTFRNEALLLGVAYNLHGEAEAGMGVLAADFDNDLDADLFITHLAEESNTLYRNRGGRRGFDDATGASGLAISSLPHTGFGTAAVDIELDSDLDLVLVNGRVTTGRTDPGSWVPAPWDLFAEGNLVYRNLGDGRFEPAEQLGAAFIAPVEVSRGLAAGDLDDDGDIDFLVTNAQSGARVWRNDAERAGNWITVRAIDPQLGRDAIGARVVVIGEGFRRLGHVTRGFSYLSSSDPRVHFGLGTLDAIERIEVRWPGGGVESFAAGEMNRIVTLNRGSGSSGG